MKRTLLFLLLVPAVYLFATNPLKLGVITDTHFMSDKLMDKGYAMQNYIYSSGKNVIASPEILDLVVSDYMQSDIQVLLVCGDMVKDGEKQSHIDFRDKLKPLYDKGVKIFVIPGNHDINIKNTVRYQGNKTFDTESTSSSDFEQIYADYGYRDALKRDVNSLSYLAQLDQSTWLLAIDASVYNKEQQRTTTYGAIAANTEAWIVNCLTEANADNKKVVAMTHWGIAEHLPLQADVFKDYLVDDYRRIADLLADNGVNLVFTGHFHSNDITAFRSEKGNMIYDIETGTLVSYPFAYRYVELTDKQVDIRTKNITSTPNHPNLSEDSKAEMIRLARQRALPVLKKKASFIRQDMIAQLSDVMGDLYAIHLYGDENIPDSIKQIISSIFEASDFPVDESLNNLEIDFPPRDNNVIITLP